MIDDELWLHVELTNRCTLACPSCPRTQLNGISKKALQKLDLNIDDFENFLNCSGGKKIKQLVLCGDYGDSIYYPHLLEFLKRFRTTKNFYIVTNGSFQTPKFWNELASILTKEDSIIFAIDGDENTNHIYRKNSNWGSIMMGLDIMVKSSAKVIWQTIIFNFNSHLLNEIKEFATNKGAEFKAIRTHRFDGDKNLIPVDQTLVETQFLYKKELNDSARSIKINPGCMREKIVAYDGKFFPCDWIRNPNTYYKSQLHTQRSRWIEKLDIKKINYDQGLEIIQDWANYVKEMGISDPSKVSILCKMKCRANDDC